MLYKKLLAVQREIGAISKDSTNPFFNSRYFDINSLLAQVKPVLNAHGLIIMQGLSNINGKLALTTTIIDTEAKAGEDEKLSVECPLPEGLDAQKAGSAITYFRRYSLQSLLGLEAEDDDGNKASGKKTTKVVRASTNPMDDEPF